jgi:hypothetical protein
MAETKEVKRVKKKRIPKCQGLLNLFALRVPERVRGRDGKNYEMYFRTGPMGGAYTKRELMVKEGLMSELAEVEKDAQKRYKSPAEVRAVVKSREVYLKQVLESRMNVMKLIISKEAEKQELIPLMASVRIHSGDEERRFFIQGFANRDGELVIGSRDDVALWAIEVMSSAQSMARKYRLAHRVGERLVEKGILAPAIKDRLATTLRS